MAGSTCAACGKPRVTSWEWASTSTDERDLAKCWAVSDDGCAAQRGGWRRLHAVERVDRERAEAEVKCLRAAIAAAEHKRDAARARAERLRAALDALRASDDAALSALGHPMS